NVTINNILPGAFDTDRLRATLSKTAEQKGKSVDQVAAERAASIPAKRFGTPDEFGAACAFLFSTHASYITGQNLLIDGGNFSGAFCKCKGRHPGPALAPLPAPAVLFGDDRFDHWCRLRRTPAIHHGQRENVDVRVDGANVINPVKRRISGHRRDVDRWILYPNVRVSEIEREAFEHLPARADRGPNPVVVGYERYTDPVIDRGNFVSTTRAQRQPVTRLILATKREEPAVLILERYRNGRGANDRGRPRSREDVGCSDPTPVCPFGCAKKSELRRYTLSNT